MDHPDAGLAGGGHRDIVLVDLAGDRGDGAHGGDRVGLAGDEILADSDGRRGGGRRTGGADVERVRARDQGQIVRHRLERNVAQLRLAVHVDIDRRCVGREVGDSNPRVAPLCRRSNGPHDSEPERGKEHGDTGEGRTENPSVAHGGSFRDTETTAVVVFSSLPQKTYLST